VLSSYCSAWVFSFKKINESWRYRLHYGYHTNNYGDDGVLVGNGWDGSKWTASFLGVILSISSTTIILKTFDELGVKPRNLQEL
jgi:hypothetical protein